MKPHHVAIIIVSCTILMFACANEKRIHFIRYYSRNPKEMFGTITKPSKTIPVNFAAHAKEIGECIKNEIKKYQNTRFMPIMHDATKGGKRLRGSILLSVCGPSVVKQNIAIKLASCIELIHCSSLILDDIMDEDIYRRGEPSIYYKYGIKDALMTSMLLLSCVGNMVKSDDNIPSEYADKFIDACNTLIQGQMKDLNESDDIAALIDEKTSVLFGLAFEIGYDLSEQESDATLEEVLEAGKLFGTAFQISDDFDDVGKDSPKINYVLKYGPKAAKEKLREIHDNCTAVFDRAGILNDDIKGLLIIYCGANNR